jgi:AbrB family looped-hinge helix DNA binding protein
MDKEKNFCFETVKVGERGQVVIPLELRKRLGINPGDKLVALSRHGRGLMLLKSEEVEEFLGHITEKMSDIKSKISNGKRK